MQKAPSVSHPERMRDSVECKGAQGTSYSELSSMAHGNCIMRLQLLTSSPIQMAIAVIAHFARLMTVLTIRGFTG